MRAAFVLALALVTGCRGEPPVEATPATASATPSPDTGTPEVDPGRAAALRAGALARAQVWMPPAQSIPRARLFENPRAGSTRFLEVQDVECRLVVKAMSGTTPKFDCRMPDGDVIRVKYGQGNPELHAEVAATRLLSALGFGADRMYVVRQVRCAGCTSSTFQSLRCMETSPLERACFRGGVDYDKVTAFAHVVIERRLEGRAIEAGATQGWAWFELDAIDPSAGGAPRAHVDALRLLASVIAHWDNKAENQRLLCLPGGDRPDGGCERPLAMLQDLGASFGPVKLDLLNWRTNPVWADPSACRVSMKHLPWGGGTFPDATISEEGRQFLLGLLQQLSMTQLEELFEGARVGQAEAITAEARQPRAWAAAFLDKVRQIREAGPCPSA